jgi:hypothetical protein
MRTRERDTQPIEDGARRAGPDEDDPATGSRPYDSKRMLATPA